MREILDDAKCSYESCPYQVCRECPEWHRFYESVELKRENVSCQRSRECKQHSGSSLMAEIGRQNKISRKYGAIAENRDNGQRILDVSAGR